MPTKAIQDTLVHAAMLCIRGSSGLANTAFTMDRVWRLYLKGPLTFVTFLKIICFRL